MSLTVSVLTGGANSHETTSAEVNAVYTDFIDEGVVGAITNTSGVAPATGAFAVNAQGTPDMTVAVSSGVAYVDGTPTSQGAQTFRVYNSASANVTIAANSSGSTKYDWIYISLDADNLNEPNTAGDNVATLVASRSSSASTDDGTPPTYGYCIAVVTVSNGASSITNGNIADSRIVAPIAQDASITNAKLSTTAGDIGGAWTTWTPTLSGRFTDGDWTKTGRYTQIGKTIHYTLSLVSTDATPMAGGSGEATFTLPVTSVSMAGTATTQPIGSATLLDFGNASLNGVVKWASTTTAVIRVNASGGTYDDDTSMSSIVPFAWGDTDEIFISGTYEAA